MVKHILSWLLLLSAVCGNGIIFARSDSQRSALLLIDIQNFYFPGSAGALEKPEKASHNAAQILGKFRNDHRLVIHVRHNAKALADIHSSVKPLPDEVIISKNHANSFRDTELLDVLRTNKIEQLVVCGMMTHMCVEAAVRAASDFGFKVILIHDACATKSLTFAETVIPAEHVHLATLAALSRSYATILDTQSYVKSR